MAIDGKRLNFLKSIISVALSTIALASVTFAWFSNLRQSDFDGIEINAAEALGFYVSLDGISYSASINMPYPDNLEFEPISGNGSKMYKPEIERGSSQITSTTQWSAVEYDPSAKVNYYFRQKIYFRCTDAGSVKLSSDTDIKPKAAPEERQVGEYVSALNRTVSGAATKDGVRNLATGNAAVPVINPSFTKDYIAGAVRLSFFNGQSCDKNGNALGNSESSGRFSYNTMYIPNNTYKITSNGGGNYSFSEYDTTDSANIEKVKYFNGSEIISANQASINVLYERQSDAVSANAWLILPITKRDDDGYYYGSLEFSLWIEGCDNEAVTVLSGGEFTCKLKFEYSASVNAL